MLARKRFVSRNPFLMNFLARDREVDSPVAPRHHLQKRRQVALAPFRLMREEDRDYASPPSGAAVWISAIAASASATRADCSACSNAVRSSASHDSFSLRAR